MKKLRLILPILVIGIVAYLLYNWTNNGAEANSVRFSGNIEVTETRMSFRIPGVMAERLVEEGDAVHAGQILARLDKTDYSIAETRAEADFSYAKSMLAELEAGSRPEEIASVRAEYDKAVAAAQSADLQLNQAKNDFDRYTKLFEEGSVNKAVFEQYRTAFDTAQKRVEEAKAQSRSAAERLALLEEGPRQETIDQAKARLEAAQALLSQAGQQLSYTELTAPMDAVVLSTSAESGEYLNPSSPVLTLGALDKPWLRAYIHEKDLGRISLNQEVTVTTDSFPDKKYKGRVSYISSQAEFTPKTVQTFEERAKLMYRIKVALENPNNELKPGMPADGVIYLRSVKKQ